MSVPPLSPPVASSVFPQHVAAWEARFCGGHVDRAQCSQTCAGRASVDVGHTDGGAGGPVVNLGSVHVANSSVNGPGSGMCEGPCGSTKRMFT